VGPVLNVEARVNHLWSIPCHRSPLQNPRRSPSGSSTARLGTISTTSYCASGACTWVRVAGNGTNLSEGGDSGGPWFSGNTAYGSHTYGIGNDSAYMPVNYFSGISVTIATS
jgi:hypothetical protein